MNTKPLVSVVVCTYNSACFILDALDSVRSQDYKNIELIITDDYSSDNTVNLCKRWIDENRDCFVDVKIIESKDNTGVSLNLNRGLKVCRGEWIKSFAGDDILKPTCISDNMTYVELNPETQVLFSDMQLFGDVKKYNKHININSHYFLLNKKDFRNRLLFKNFIPAPTLFIKSKVFDEYGYYDETIPMMEDWPYWMHLLHNNVEMKYMNKSTVMYRVHESISISKTPSQSFIVSQNRARKLSLLYAKDVSLLLSLYIRIFYYSPQKGYVKLFKWLLLLSNPFHYYFKRLERSVQHM